MKRFLLTTALVILVAGCSTTSAEKPSVRTTGPSGSTDDGSQDTVAEVFSALAQDQSPTWTRGGEDVDAEELSAFAGDEHCSWERVVFLHLGRPHGTVPQSSNEFRQYIRDPRGGVEVGPQDELDLTARLPDDAKDTTYRLGDLQLWLAPSDPDGAYLRLGDDLERWPRANPPIACA